MAEFDDADGARRGRARRPRGRLPQHRRLHALPDRGAARGARTCTSRTLPLLVLAGGLLGAASAATALQYWASVIEYPMNIGGRPFHSWPAFICRPSRRTILCAALAAVLGMLALNGLPQPYHPVFNVPRFALASARPLLPVHRGARPAVRPRRRRASFLRRLRPARSPRCTEVNATVTRARRGVSRSALALALSRVVLAGCRQDMHDQPQATSRCEASELLRRRALGAAARRGHGRARHAARGRRAFFTGKADGRLRQPSCPCRSTRELLARGRERYDIFCSPCHGRPAAATA